MKTLMVSLLSVVCVSVAQAVESPEALTCSEIAEVDLDQTHASQPANVSIKLMSLPSDGSLPGVMVDNLPEGSGLKMSYQDIFGLGKQPDGAVIYATKESGDGTIQDICGDDSFTTLIEVKKSGKNYCAKCTAL